MGIPAAAVVAVAETTAVQVKGKCQVEVEANCNIVVVHLVVDNSQYNPLGFPRGILRMARDDRLKNWYPGMADL